MAQDFWASSGYRDLVRVGTGLAPTPAWFRRFLEREELQLPPDAGAAERALHAKLSANPMAHIAPPELDALDDADARENWREFLHFRDRVSAFPTLEEAYRDLYARPAVDLAPPFVEALVHAITRGLLEESDAWLCRAGEMLFRPQRVSVEDGQVLAADAATIEAFQATGGFGGMGRLLASQGVDLAPVKMDVLNSHNAALYFMRDELYSFVLDLTPGREGAHAFATVVERWVAHLAGAAVTIEPVARVEDERWRWHIGLDVDSTAILNALYRGEAVAEDNLARLLALFRMTFRDASIVRPDVRGKPVYLGLACRPDRTLRVKPQNLLVNLPLAAPLGPSA